MAEIPMSGQGLHPAEPRTIGPLVNMVGAVASLALVVGTGMWGYKLLMRDVSGVPVVRAVEGPMRIQPEEPGGRQADHQGFAVNTVAADGSAAPPADRLTLAPPPIDLSKDDAANSNANMAILQPASVPLGDAAARNETQNADASDIVAPPPLSSDRIDAIEAFASQLAGDAQPLSEARPAVTAPVKVSLGEISETEAPAPADTEPRPVFTNGLSHSLRPVLRPEGLAQPVEMAAASATEIVMPNASPIAVDAASVPVGTHLVQLGAFASAEIAESEWLKLSSRFGDYLGDKTRVIQEATSGGRVFYRLRAMGFADLSDARRMCSALKAERADCIPVTVR